MKLFSILISFAFYTLITLNVFADTVNNEKVIKHNLCFNNNCPVGASEDNYLVDHDIFILSSNRITKFADWVGYKIDYANLNGPSRHRTWMQDPLINSEDTLSPNDYDGAAATCGYDRGHQAPLGDFTNNSSWSNTNYLSNITPQLADLNQGAWNSLEIAERKLASKYGQIYVVTGPYYQNKDMCKLPKSKTNEVIPNGYWKVISVIDDNGNEEHIAFAFKQETKRKDSYCNHIVELDSLNELTSLNILPKHEGGEYQDLTINLGCS